MSGCRTVGCPKQNSWASYSKSYHSGIGFLKNQSWAIKGLLRYSRLLHTESCSNGLCTSSMAFGIPPRLSYKVTVLYHCIAFYRIRVHFVTTNSNFGRDIQGYNCTTSYCCDQFSNLDAIETSSNV